MAANTNALRERWVPLHGKFHENILIFVEPLTNHYGRYFPHMLRNILHRYWWKQIINASHWVNCLLTVTEAVTAQIQTHISPKSKTAAHG